MKGDIYMKSLIRNAFEKPFGFYLDRFFDNDYEWYRKSNGLVNISEEKDGYMIEVSAPGFTKEELKINIEEKILTVTGEHKEEKNDSDENYTRKEFSKQSFERSFSIPDDIDGDGFDAKFENGVLKVSIKKKLLPKSDPKQIEIK
jgi:HSP20 family protein